MGKYLKMADVFVGEYKPKRRIDVWPPSKHGETLVELSGSPAQYAAHAINSHDELVENMQHYKQEAEQWEARATKAASRAQDLEVEVERLRVIIDIKPMANRYNNDIDDFDNEIIMSGV